MQTSFAQSSFLGGEWSKQFQGNFNRDDYRVSMNVCLNIIPLEEGAAARRPGTKFGGSTRNGVPGVLRQFFFSDQDPFDIELTAGHLRLWGADAGLVTENTAQQVNSVSAANPAVITTVGNHGWSTGDQVLFFAAGATNWGQLAPLLARQMAITVTGNNAFTIADAVTGTTIDGSTVTLADASPYMTVSRILDIAVPYAEQDLQSIVALQDGANVLLLHQNYQTLQITLSTANSGNQDIVSFTLAPAVFNDGPYLDPPTDGTTLTPDATSGNINITASSITNINSGQGFINTDAGRLIRLFSEPLAWLSGHAYSTNDTVKYADVYWKAVAASTGVQPDTDNGTHWVISPTSAAWTWGSIVSITDTSHCVIQLQAAVTTPDNVAGGNLLYTNPVNTWQLGLYNNVTWPAVGTYYQGRVWLGGAQPNRFDACVSNDYGNHGYINFAPTGLDGTVADNNGISGTLNAKEIENFVWMLPDEQGVLAGTASGEWVIASSSASEPITPTSIQTRELTRYGSLVGAQAIKVGRATIFIHRDQRKVYEYMANYFTQKFVADNLTLRAKHLTTAGVDEVAYVRELTPIIWARLDNGSLIGCTYKHDDPIKPMEFNGWHRHSFGHNRTVLSIQGGPSADGKTDTLSLISKDPVTGFCFVEFLTTLWDQGDSLLTAWFTDGVGQIIGGDHLTVNGVPIIRFYGLWYAVGKTVSAFIAGLDCGDFLVSSNGSIDIPIDGSANSSLTQAFIVTIVPNATDFWLNIT